jgi:hypothetical protein
MLTGPKEEEEEEEGEQLCPVCMSLNGSRDSETDVGILKMVQRVEICQPLEIQKQLLKSVKLCPWTIG